MEVIFWFSLFYRNIHWRVVPKDVSFGSLFGGLKFSFATMTTFGSTMILSEGACINFLIFIQAIISLFFVMMSIARVVSLISKAKEVEKKSN